MKPIPDDHTSVIASAPRGDDDAPVLIIPYMWLGDFVRCHTVVRLLRAQRPQRPVDMLTTANAAPLTDYMPGLRKGIVWDLARNRIVPSQQWQLAARLRKEGYGQVLVMPRTWKSALAPFLAGIPRRTGFTGELRFGLVNDLRWGERALPRMIERCSALALPVGASLPDPLPVPQLVVTADETGAWRVQHQLTDDARPIVTLAPGAVGPAKRWPGESYAALAKKLARDGWQVWVVGGPGERDVAREIAAQDAAIHDLTGTDLRNAIVALAAAKVAITNNSGLLHVAAALGTPSIGIFGPTSAWHWAPLNPLAAVIQAPVQLPCQPCHRPVCRLGHHQCMHDVTVETVVRAAESARELARFDAQ